MQDRGSAENLDQLARSSVVGAAGVYGRPDDLPGKRPPGSPPKAIPCSGDAQEGVCGSGSPHELRAWEDGGHGGAQRQESDASKSSRMMRTESRSSRLKEVDPYGL